MFSYKLLLTYDGTCYFGWQKTRMGPSVQEALENAILQITGEKATPEAASRTDRGVHAEGQSVSFSISKEIDPYRLLGGLNAALPPDIRILELMSCESSFHPTLDASSKEYHYRLCLGPVQDPTQRLYSWHLKTALDLKKMERAARDLLGQKDFSAFANEKKENPICTIEEITFERLQIRLVGDRFLYKMVRNLVGTLVYIGIGKLPEDCIPALLASKDRKAAGVTAPAHGLFLHRVFYNPSDKL
jgi:tRNA pseudouridine38-40 synthase